MGNQQPSKILKGGIRTMQWKALDTDSEYEISDTGLVRKVHTMKAYVDRDGYSRIAVTKDGKRVNIGIHRLVLHTYDPRPNENELEVHHIDGNPANNNLNNLQWVTHEENIKFIDSNKLKSPTQFIARKVVQLSLDGKELAVFDSAYQAYKMTGCNHRHISEVCAGKRLTTGGFKWKYFEGSTTNCSDKCHETGDSNKMDEDIV